MAPTLAYWDIRGLGQPIRLLLTYTGTEFEDKKYVCGPAPDYDKSCWFNEKFNLGLSFPNLPYYIDGDVKITQTNAILRHIARKHDLCGKTEQEKIRVDVIENQIGDIRTGYVQASYNPKFDDLKEDLIKKLGGQLKELSDFLGDYKWFAGDNITYIDFVVYDLLDQFKVLNAEIVEKHQNLKDFTSRVESLDKIAEYIKSDKFIKRPFNNRMAKFGNE